MPMNLTEGQAEIEVTSTDLKPFSLVYWVVFIAKTLVDIMSLFLVFHYGLRGF